MNGRQWLSLIVFGWVSLIVASSFYGDPDDYFVVSKIQVDNAVAGQEPIVRYSRWIKQEFRASFIVELNEMSPNGPTNPCVGEGGYLYTPGDFKPTEMTLSEFMRGKCELIPGKSYIVDVVWALRADGVPPMTVSRTSNVFEVVKRQDRVGAAGAGQGATLPANWYFDPAGKLKRSVELIKARRAMYSTALAGRRS